MRGCGCLLAGCFHHANPINELAAQGNYSCGAIEPIFNVMGGIRAGIKNYKPLRKWREPTIILRCTNYR